MIDTKKLLMIGEDPKEIKLEDVPFNWRLWVNPDENKVQKSFKNCFDYLTQRKNDIGAILVRGYCSFFSGMPDLKCSHSWVVIRTKEFEAVFDGVMQKFYDIDSYYKSLACKEMVCLTRKTALEQMSLAKINDKLDEFLNPETDIITNA